MDIGVAGEDALKCARDLKHILRLVDPAIPQPGPVTWRLHGRHQDVTPWMGIGVGIGIDANAHPKAVALCLQPPAQGIGAEEGHLDAGQQEFRL